MELARSTIRVIILGAGKGGTALLELFTRSPDVEVVGMADRNPEAPGLRLAKYLGIPTTSDSLEIGRAHV